MSTRCQVIVKDEYCEQWFYRHCDGYPEGTMPTLRKFLKWVKSGKIRNNVEQACGWLVILGHHEFLADGVGELLEVDGIPTNWEVGSYEPCPPEEHGDIEFLYTIDLKKEKISCKDINSGKRVIL